MNRPVYRLGCHKFASPAGFCCHCPDRALTAVHYFLLCPRYVTERGAFLTRVANALMVPNVNTLTILMCGSNHTSNQQKLRDIAVAISDFIRATMYTATLYFDSFRLR